MTVLVINVGNVDYGKYSIPLIEKLCDYNNVNLFVLDKNIPQNIYGLHPSWLKLFSFDLVNDDFIITWDLDLIPFKLYDFKTLFDVKKLNLSYDPSYTRFNFTFNGKFKYNCGLMGIPRKYSEDLKNVYLNNGKNSNYPSYEQYHVNDWIFDNNYDVNLLDYKLNTLFEGNENFEDNLLNIHYTWKVNSSNHRLELIKKHSEKYDKNF
jgi:hypothetical protein